MIVLGIETSCDETAASIVELKNNKKKILSNILYSQFKEHKDYGGVVPEIAFREHLKLIDKIILRALRKAKKKFKEIDVVAATGGPGLHGGLLIGTTIAKSISLSIDKPFMPINHLEGHILSPRIEYNLSFPYLVLLITGGHTMLVIAHRIGKYEILGMTLDDALGEAFDKTAKLIGIKFPGGPQIESFAEKGDKNYFKLPKPILNKGGCNLSFAGLKTAVLKISKNINNKKESLKKEIDEEIKKAETEILDLKNKSPEKINKIAIETSADLIKQIIGAEINKSNISAIVGDISKKNKEKYYGN